MSSATRCRIDTRTTQNRPGDLFYLSTYTSNCVTPALFFKMSTPYYAINGRLQQRLVLLKFFLTHLHLGHRYPSTLHPSVSPLSLTALHVVAACEIVEEEGIHDGDLPVVYVHSAALLAGVVVVEQTTIDGYCDVLALRREVLCGEQKMGGGGRGEGGGADERLTGSFSCYGSPPKT